MRTLPKKLIAVCVAAAAALSLSACAGGSKEAAVGEALENVEVAGPDTEATVTMTVESIETAPMSDYAEQLQLQGDFDNGTVFIVRYTAQLSEGEVESDDTYPFSHYNWTANATDDSEVFVVQQGLGGAIEIEDCTLYSADKAAELAAGNEISACAIFATKEADTQLERVIYNQPMFRGSGWQWQNS